LVGDQKSPSIPSSENLTFLSLADQRRLAYALGWVCPLNHYARKNIGYLYALQKGAEIMYDTDDDNLPYNSWNLPEFHCSRASTSTALFVNIYRYFSDALVWPRGFPLDEIGRPSRIEPLEDTSLSVGVWQGLAACNPDVDSIYRLILNHPVGFKDKPPFALNRGSYSPLNSQNTFWHRSAFPYLYLPATVNSRFTDILRGYVAQALMWRHDRHLGVTGATVYQERNTHDTMEDFAGEIGAYLHVKKVIHILNSLRYSTDSLQNLEMVYQALAENRIVKPEETNLCRAWIKDFRTLTGNPGL